MKRSGEDYKETHMVGIATESYKCPKCGSEEYEENPLMRGGVNCMCKKCDTLFHVIAF